MAGREPDPLELQAAAVVVEYVGGEAVSRDGVDAPSGAHDFDINHPDGRTIALEVTTIADTKLQRFYAIMGDTDWLAPELGTNWSIRLPEPQAGQPIIRPKRRMPTIASALAALESYGISQLEWHTLDPWALLPDSTPPDVREAIVKLRSAGVTSARSTGQKPDEVARLYFGTHGGATGNPDQLNELVVERADVKCEKLAAAQASERHLFIWLTDSYPDAELAFATLPPPAPPSIPADIDVVWLAGFVGPIRLWRLRPPGGWEIVDDGRAGRTVYGRRQFPVVDRDP